MLLDPHQPDHRCRACRLVKDRCICPLAPRLSLETKVAVIMHAREWRRASNTGHLVRLALANGDVRLHGLPRQPLDDRGLASPGTLVLYPGHGARPLTPELVAALPRPLTLLVPDGNWTQAKNMMRRVPLLKSALPVALPGPLLAGLRPRRNAFPDRMATFEAVAQALGILESEAVQEQLLDFFQAAVERMLLLRGKIKASQLAFGVSP